MNDMFSLAGKVALVSGGGRGLGRGMAAALARAGADVAVTSRSEAQLAETTALLDRQGGRTLAVAGDLEEPDAPGAVIGEVLAARGRLDILVHAAGVQIRKPVAELSAQEWDRVQAVHLRAGFLLAQAAAAAMMRRGEGGKIIVVGSLTTTIGIPATAAYAAAKSGLLGLARTLAVELAPHGICVNAIAPGYFHTAMTDDLFSDPRRRAEIMSRIPLGRTGEPEDLGGATVFLASAASDYVTGQTIAVDGGWLAS
jgi:NAD(P)-dependent dehydrogenase (short-subunit alcohol dehydrogenase family)